MTGCIRKLIFKTFSCLMKIFQLIHRPPQVVYFDPERCRVGDRVKLRGGYHAIITRKYLEGREYVFNGVFCRDANLPINVSHTLSMTQLKWFNDGKYNQTTKRYLGEIYNLNHHPYDIASVVVSDKKM